MKKFYRKIIFFMLPVLIIWGGLEFFYRSTETNYTFKNKKLIEQYDDLEVLILGNSQALYGLNPQYFSNKTFNSSNISQSLYFDELILNKHSDNFSELKAVVINISYFSLSQQDNTSEDLWRKYFYDQQMKLDVPIVSDYDIKKYSLALSRRFNKSVELLLEYLGQGTILNCNMDGYGLQDESNIVKDKEAISPIIAKKHENNSLDFGKNTNRLEQIAAFCKKRNIDVILVELPVYKTYFDLLDPIKKNKIKSTCITLSEEYDNLHYIDLLQHPDFNENDLRDADHLTNEGAKKCSIILDTAIQSILSKS